MPLKLLITGGAGFIGSNLAAMVLDDHPDTEITVIDDFSTGMRENLAGLDAELVEGSILDAALLNRVAANADSIVHLAARPSVPRSIEDPGASHAVNATGTLNVLQAARESGAHVVVASSSSVYGANPRLPKVETMTPQPMSPYAATKLAAESYAIAWGHSFGIRSIAFRFFNVYGPHQAPGHAYAAVIPAFLDNAIKGKPLEVNGDGTQTRDFTFVGTVCSVLTKACIERKTHDMPVNLALGTRTSLNSLIEMVGDCVDTAIEVIHRPARPGDVPHSSADPTLLRALFPDVPAVPLDEGLRLTYRWLAGRS